MKALFVTAAYGSLWNTELGGRSGRHDHYLQSLCSLSKMGAHFVVYTSAAEIENVSAMLCSNFDPQSTFEIREQDLRLHPLHADILRLQGGHNNMWPDRCIQLQYFKLLWLKQALEETADTYTHYYWIDAGLSHQGLFPAIYACGTDWYTNQYHFSLFNSRRLYNLNEMCDSGKIFTAAKTPPDAPAPEHTYYIPEMVERRGHFHVVGGWFGGRPGPTLWLCKMFEELSKNMINNGDLYSEEQILSVIATNYPHLFDLHNFETWYHRDNIAQLAPHLDPTTKSFCNVVEQLDTR